MIAGACFTFLQREAIDPCSIEAMGCGPAVETISDIGGNAFLARDVDEDWNKTVVALAVRRWWKTQGHRANAVLGHREAGLFGDAGEARAGRDHVIFRRGASLRQKRDAGSDNQGAVRAGERCAECLDRASVDFAVLLEF